MNISKVEISAISFYIMGNDDNMRDSVITVRHEEAYHQGVPTADGPYSLAMGTTDSEYRCTTCQNKTKLCYGHPGSLILKYPVYSSFFVKNEIKKWLKIICYSCGNIIISDERLEHLRNKKSKKNLVQIVAQDTHQKTRVNPTCSKCGTVNPMIKKDTTDNVSMILEYYRNGEMIEQRRLYPHEVETIFNKIPDEVVIKLERKLISHPRKLVLRILRVSPNTIRPDAREIGKGRSNKNDLTKLLQTIISTNDKLPDKIPEVIDNDFWKIVNILNLSVYEMIRGSTNKNKGVQTNNHQQLESIAKRIPGKHGRIRGNLMGSRAGRMGRSIITCDPQLEPDQVRIPYRICMNLPQETIVREYNYKKMMIYYMNGPHRYPGCKGIKKGSTGIYRDILTIEGNFILEIGDTVFHHTVEGDIVQFNRQPSLEISSLTSMRVMVRYDGETIGLNVIDCPLFNADFDGDEMNIIFVISTRAQNESMMLSSPTQRFISFKNSSPVLGQSQDNLVGCYELTKNTTRLDKFHAMDLFSNTGLRPRFEENRLYKGQEIITKLFQTSGDLITYEGIPKIYKSTQEKFRLYDSEDIKVRIHNGEHISGVLDKNSVGEGARGGIFHIIYNKYGPNRALKAVYNLQQIALKFMFNKGVTITPADAMMNKKATQHINEINNNLFVESKLITDKLNNGELIPPLNKNISEYYEDIQLNTLNAGDSYWEHIFNSIDTSTNFLFIYPDTGTKGKEFNFINSSCSVGQVTLNGLRMTESLSGRSSPYYTKYDSDPCSRGFVAESFLTGLQVPGHLFSAWVGRGAIIDRSMSTAKAGSQGRSSTKNLEGHIINYHRSSESSGRIIQFLYGGDGVDPRFLEKVKIPTIMLNNDQIKIYHVFTKDLDKKFNNKNVQDLLDAEFEQIVVDRDKYRKLFVDMEISSGRPISDEMSLPINIKRLIRSSIHAIKGSSLNVITAMEKIKSFIDDIAYHHTNEIYQAARKRLPTYLVKSLEYLKIYLRSLLNIYTLLKMNVSDEALDILIEEANMTYLKSLVSYGKTMGSIASQSISEPLTQIIIDSHHHELGGSDKKKGIQEIETILKVHTTEKMSDPTMTIYVISEYENDKDKVQEIASNIEMLPMWLFIENPLVFFEEFGRPTHPSYKHESKMISDFRKYNPNITPPIDLMNICIRINLIKEKLIEKHISTGSIYLAIKREYPELFVVYNDENSEEVLLRIYIRSTMVREEPTELMMNSIISDISNIIVRGVDGILAAHVKDKMVSYIDENGEISKKEIYFMLTEGANIDEIMLNPYVDLNRLDSGSVMDIYDNYGSECSRVKIINELHFQIGGQAEYRHFMDYADEMIWTGVPTSVDRFGSAKRNSSVLMRVSDADPLRTLEAAAIFNMRDELDGISPSIMLGKNPHIGDLYGTFKLDEEFIAAHVKREQQIIEDI